MKCYYIFVIFAVLTTACGQTGKKVETEDVVKIISSMNTNSNDHTIKKTEQNIHRFFVRYEKLYNTAITTGKIDTTATADSFTECFIESSPVGVICGKNDKEFKKKIIEGFKFYRSIGTESMKISNKEITLLDDYHAMAKVHWQASIIRKNRSEVKIDFDVIYMLQFIDNNIKIFAYIAEDEQKSYKENAIEPYQ